MAKYDLKQGMEKIRAKHGWDFAPKRVIRKSLWSKFTSWLNKRIDYPANILKKKPDGSPEVKKLIEDDARKVFEEFYGKEFYGPKLFMEKMKGLGWSEESIKKLGQKVAR